MSSVVSPDIKRGRLTAPEKDEIVRLAEKGLSGGRIAQKLNRHPATINWAMLRLGLRQPTLYATTKAYSRNGTPVVPFGEPEDEVLTALRVAGLTTTKIAERLTERFGHRRSAHTVNMRLVLLANAEAA